MKSRFFQRNFLHFTLAQIIEITQCSPQEMLDLQTIITDVNTIKNATSSEISFLSSEKYFHDLQNSSCGFCLVNEKHLTKIPKHIKALVHKNPYYAYSQLVCALYKPILPSFDGNLIHTTAKIGNNTIIAPNAYIGKNVIIGENCFIGPNASICDGVIIGNNCKINANASIAFAIIGNNCEIYCGTNIGQDGFGFAYHNGVNHKIQQIGIVEIGNNVEIGSGSCIDRGAIESTIIADGVKIDNLCQIAHNVNIGQGTVIAGCTAIAGSAKIGKFVQIGGSSNIAGHLSIGDGAKIAGMSGIMRDIEPMSTVAGSPALPIKKWHRLNVLLHKMIGQ